jgi:hypothetical protein
MSPRIQSVVVRRLTPESGQSAVQYVLILAPMVAAIVLGAVTVVMSVS